MVRRPVPWLWALLAIVIVVGIALGIGQPWKQDPVAAEIATPTAPAVVLAETPTAQPTPAPTEEPLPPTVTPPIPNPLPVALQSEGCGSLETNIIDDMGRAGGARAEGDALMGITLICEGDTISTTLQFPPQPAQRVEFLDEPSAMTVTLSRPYARTLIEAAVRYATGNYAEAASRLTQMPAAAHGSGSHWLHALALMHSEQWRAAATPTRGCCRKAESTEMQAQAHAGLGLSYGLTALVDDRQETKEACINQGLNDAARAVELQANRALWQASQVYVRTICPPNLTDYESAIEANQRDVEEAYLLSNETNRFEKAQVQSLLAHILYEFQDYSRSRDLAQRAIELAPELASPYNTLACLHFSTAETDQARAYFSLYMARLTLSRLRGCCPNPMAERNLLPLN